MCENSKFSWPCKKVKKMSRSKQQVVCTTSSSPWLKVKVKRFNDIWVHKQVFWMDGWTVGIARSIPAYAGGQTVIKWQGSQLKCRNKFPDFPVSLLPCISKILEKIIYKRLYNFWLIQNIFYNSQYGFRTKHSTINAVTELSNHVAKSIESKQCTLAVFLDLSNAFDTIDCMTLLSKLALHGVRGIALEWFRNYLTNRRQYVQINEKNSNTETVTYGAPQGSVIGPFFF